MSLPITRGLGARPSLGSDARSEGHPRLWAAVVLRSAGAVPPLLRLENVMSKQEEMG